MTNEPDPNCPECHGEGRIQEGTGRGNSDGGEDWREIDCPACIEAQRTGRFPSTSTNVSTQPVTEAVHYPLWRHQFPSPCY